MSRLFQIIPSELTGVLQLIGVSFVQFAVKSHNLRFVESLRYFTLFLSNQKEIHLIMLEPVYVIRLSFLMITSS